MIDHDIEPVCLFLILFEIGIAGNHPLRGMNDDEIGPRFPAVSDAYDGDLQDIVLQCAKDLGLQVHLTFPSTSVDSPFTFAFISLIIL